VLLFVLGEAPQAMKAQHGCYHQWFEAAYDARLTVVDGRGGGRAPDARDYSGVIVSGSPATLCAPERWMDEAAELIHGCRKVGVPLLGVCFGHQLLGYALGGRIVKNPAGWEVGTCEIELNEHGQREPIFAGVPARARVNLTHLDIIEPASRPSDLRVLARNAATDIQAAGVDDFLWGVQFHPEITGTIMRGYLHARRPLLEEHDQHDCDELHENADDCPDGLRVLTNFRAVVDKA
jgi:GMP synthase (glutamine-hydrolysing)